MGLKLFHEPSIHRITALNGFKRAVELIHFRQKAVRLKVFSEDNSSRDHILLHDCKAKLWPARTDDTQD